MKKIYLLVTCANVEEAIAEAQYFAINTNNKKKLYALTINDKRFQIGIDDVSDNHTCQINFQIRQDKNDNNARNSGGSSTFSTQVSNVRVGYSLEIQIVKANLVPNSEYKVYVLAYERHDGAQFTLDTLPSTLRSWVDDEKRNPMNFGVKKLDW